MPNALTGDFEAVLEISNTTFDRLLASMHQNGFADTTKPSVPHVVHFRLGDRDVPGSERGTTAAQVGVPHVILIHGATDRFLLQFGIRARYRADPGSKPLADVIHGTVRAEYRFQDIDPTCWGWHGIADDYLWMRVVGDSVSFDGTVYSESDIFAQVQLADEQQVRARITQLLRDVLRNQFEPAPQPIGQQFRRIRCLSHGDAPGQAAVAIPFGLNGQIPTGNLASMNNLFLEGRDFGLAISRESILSTLQPKLEPLVGLQRDFRISSDAGIGGGLVIDYHVRVDSVVAEWLGPLAIPFFPQSSGFFRIRVTGSGWSTRLYRSGIYNVGSVSLADLKMSFSADQFFALGFDAGGERLTITPFGTPAVSVNYNGPFAGEMKPFASDAIAKQLQGNIAGPLSQAQSELSSLTSPEKKSALIEQLRRIDGSADARFDEAVFRAEGVILRGRISLTFRHPPKVSFEKNAAADGFDAIESWIPGGRVDSFQWTWRWFTNPIEAPHGPPGSSTSQDDFMLKRPHGQRSKFGLAMGIKKPLPGLDGNGRVCLLIRGVRVDHVTGALVPVESVGECAQFGYELKLPYEVGPYIRICDPLRGVEARPAPEIGILRVGMPEVPDSASNTLVLYLDREWSEEAATNLGKGLESCRRVGSGLLVAILFPDGALDRANPQLRSRLQELRASLPAPLMVNEDVYGSWSNVLGIRTTGEPAWRLITPDGRVCWSHEGVVEARTLASILEERLVVSHPPGQSSIRSAFDFRGRISLDLFVRPCPPVPLGRPGGSKLVFVRKDRTSSLALLDRLAGELTRGDDNGSFVAIVVEGADVDEAEALRLRHNLPPTTIPDPTGELTRLAGIRVTPAILSIDDQGKANSIETGLDNPGRTTAHEGV